MLCPSFLRFISILFHSPRSLFCCTPTWQWFSSFLRNLKGDDIIWKCSINRSWPPQLIVWEWAPPAFRPKVAVQSGRCYQINTSCSMKIREWVLAQGSQVCCHTPLCNILHRLLFSKVLLTSVGKVTYNSILSGKVCLECVMNNTHQWILTTNKNFVQIWYQHSSM